MENMCAFVAHGLPAKVNLIILADTNPSNNSWVTQVEWGDCPEHFCSGFFVY